VKYAKWKKIYQGKRKGHRFLPNHIHNASTAENQAAKLLGHLLHEPGFFYMNQLRRNVSSDEVLQKL
jgi:hypothetical protein